MKARILLDGEYITLDGFDRLHPDLRARIVAGEGEFVWPESHPLAGRALHRVLANQMRVQLTRGAKPLPKTEFQGLTEEDAEERLWAIPLLWPEGTHCTLGGPDKAGKSTFVASLVAALVVPDCPFLRKFEPVEDTGRTVWVINCETPKVDFENGLDRAGVAARDDLSVLYVDHLRDMGGPARFDLTQPAIFDEWKDRMLACFECDGTDFLTPHFVIVDGLTAIAHAVGKSPELYYGQWFVAFRQLMDFLGIPNSLVVAHTGKDGKHLLGGVESSANQDGLWILDAAHRFSVQSRMGGENIPPTKIELDAAGQPRAVSRSIGIPTDPAAQQTEPSLVERVLSLLESVHPRELRIGEIRSALGGDAAAVDRAVRDIVADGRLIRTGKEGRGAVKTYRLRSGQDDDAADDGKASA